MALAGGGWDGSEEPAAEWRQILDGMLLLGAEPTRSDQPDF